MRRISMDGTRIANGITAACAAVLVLGAAAPLALAEDQTLGELGFAKQRLSLVSGFGWGFGAFGSEGHDTSDANTVPLIASWAIGSEPFFDETPFVSNVEIQLEAQLLLLTQPGSGFGGGGAFALRYNWLAWDPVFWFIEIGLGIVGIDYDLEQSDGFNFILQSGTGLHWRLGNDWALTTQYRFHHISNAKLKSDNPGINSHMVLIGPTFYFK